MLNTALGGGLSSRLFQQVRELRGLAYSVYSTVDVFADSGALSVYAACQPERFAEVMAVTSDVLESVARDGITESECRIAKGSLRGGLVLGLEDSSSRMSRLGRSELNYGKHRSIEHTLRQIDRGDRRGGQRGGPPAARATLRRRGPGPLCRETVTAPTTSGDGKLAEWYWASWDIMVPIVGAPMAGGPGTPALAAAVSNAGGLGFVPGGHRSAEQFADDIAAARKATTGPLGVNLFVPQPSVADWVALHYYAAELEEIAEHYQVEVGHPQSRRRRRVGAEARSGGRRPPRAGVLHLRRAVRPTSSGGWARWACW